MSTRSLVLVCNSHIDPVWLWPWEEGLAATLATFRAAADLCEEFDDFVFCHNEALLYQWVEQYEPALFARLQGLVKAGRWHIMGGWFVQPDCNLPSGESLVRQTLIGKRYFLDRFGVEPKVAINFDPFGHTRGLVQILAKAGYEGYLFCRPDARWLSLPADDFRWIGYDGSSVLAHRAAEHYNSERGRARVKVERWLQAHETEERGLLLWGVGNHGGGPSREDLRELASLRAVRPSRRQILHGRPEDYFASLREDADRLPAHEQDLNPWAVGCYTSMATVKGAHARLERALFATETLSAAAAIQGLLPYPSAALREALEDLLFCQFHDILPGEGVREVEQQALDRLGHGAEIAGRLRARAFFALLSGQQAAADGEYPIVAINHLPVRVRETLVVEFQPPEPNVDTGVFWEPGVRDASGRLLPSQLEKESCNIQVDQRKRVVFEAALEPLAPTRFSCRLMAVPRAASPGVRAVVEPLVHRNGRLHVEVDPNTGLLSRYAADGVEYLAAPAPRPLVFHDSADPWGMKVRAFRDLAGAFALAGPRSASALAGVRGDALPPVRVIEHGPVRTVVEALFEHGRSALSLRYKLPARGTAVEIEAVVSWFETDRLLKLSFPTACTGEARCQVPYGVETVRRETEELVGHRWQALLTPDGLHALTLVNDATYGFDVSRGELRVSLLRAPAYAGHPVDEVTPIVRQDRFEPREDQGLHRFRFWMEGGAAAERLAAVDRESVLRPDGVTALCVFPPGGGRPALPGLVLADDTVRLGALKMSEDGTQLIVRLFETTGTARRVGVRLPALDLFFEITLCPFELKTLAIEPGTGSIREADLVERVLPRP